MASLEWESASGRPLAAGDEAPTDARPLSTAEDPVEPTGAADAYECTVDRLFALLEENQIAITALAQAWRHTNRTLQLTEAQLAHAQESLAAERRSRPGLVSLARSQRANDAGKAESDQSE